jgi:E3 ubiquitin-protein ligase HUWE1
LRANTNYNGYNRNSPQIVWFWEIMESFDREEKGNLLQFVTGSSKVPVEGFALLQGMNGPEKFQITRIIANDVMRLPQGHTCFNQLDLPEYASKEIMRERLMWAIKETAGFGFA